jgi:hypothetical protein
LINAIAANPLDKVFKLILPVSSTILVSPPLKIAAKLFVPFIIPIPL